MAVSLTHSKVSGKAAGADPTLVYGTHWDAEHTLTQATGKLLGRTTAGTGATEEITPSAALSFSAGALDIAATITAAGPIGSGTDVPVITYNAKGQLTTVTTTTVTPAVGSVTGFGTGVATALAVNVGSAGAFVTFNGALGTPSSGTATNLTGTASGLTAGNVTTNANLTGPITSVGNATSIASQTGTGTKFVVDTSPTLVTPVLGVASATSINALTLSAPSSDTTAGASIAIGTNALANQPASAAYSNIAIGRNALSSASMTTLAIQNVAIGHGALQTATSATGNVAIGFGALENGTTAYNSIAIGVWALRSATGGHNTAVGNNALRFISTGQTNCAFGDTAASAITTGSNNCAFGDEALNTATVAVGSNSAFGNFALHDTQGNEGTAVGFSAVRFSSGAKNAALGAFAGYGVTATTTAAESVFVGYYSGFGITTGQRNIFVGTKAGEITTTGSDNIVVGYDIDTTGATVSDYLNIGGAIKGDMATGAYSLTDKTGATPATLSAGPITLGANGGTGGSVKLYGATSGDATIRVAAAAGTATIFQLPATNGSNTNILQTDGAGVTSWVAAPAASLTVGTSSIASGADTRILYDNAGTLGEYTISGTGTVVAMAASPSLTTPALGVATGTSLALGGATIGGNALAVTGASLFNSQVTNSLGTITTSQPLTLTQTWNDAGVTFNSLLVNVTSTASAAASLLMDLQVGGVTKFNVGKDGGARSTGYRVAATGNPTVDISYTTTAVALGSAYSFAWSSSGNASSGLDTYLTRGGVATVRLGLANAASPVAQTLVVQGSRSGTDSNVGGASFTVQAGPGTGTGTLSSLILQSPILVASGTGAQTQTTGWTIKGGQSVASSYTVATLPTGIAGGVAYVTDGDASLAWGATVINSGAGATPYFVMFNATNWTVMGK